MENSFIATKVSFVNEFYDLAETIGVNFNELRELWLADSRVSRHHTYCYGNNRGFAGKCLPKDLKNLAHFFRMKGKPSGFMEFIISYNQNKWRGKCEVL
jgi:UDPglucose 6-dehydrogenase